MALTVKKITLWRTEVSHRAGMLADVLEPLAAAGVNLRVVSGYAFPAGPDGAAIEVFPIAGKKAARAATAVGLSPSPTACLLVEGDDRPGLGAAMARAIAAAGVSISFRMAENFGRKFSAVFAFEDEGDAATAAKAIKSAARARRR